MPSPSGARGYKAQLRQFLVPSWRGMLLNISHLAYTLLLAVCIADGLSLGTSLLVAFAGRLGVLQASLVRPVVHLIVQLWSLLLLLRACQASAGESATKAASDLPPVARAAQSCEGFVGRPRPSREKLTRVGQGFGFSYVSCEMQGWRPEMEDALVCAPDIESAFCASNASQALFGVMDGHGGSEVSCYVAQLLVRKVRSCIARGDPSSVALKRAILQIEDDLRKASAHGRWRHMGCTVAVALLTPSCVSVASVGDSRVFKCRKGAVVPLTRDHRPESPRERRRIEAAGGMVAKFGQCYRIDASLNMSRALGDFSLKDPNLPQDRQMISPVPDVTVSEIDADDEFLVVACDGLFELMSWETVCEYIHKRIRTRPLAEIAEGLLDACCSHSVPATMGRGTDNESVIIVKLHGQTSSLPSR
mmetsp:Transcript_132616/g.383388  ORF Transcript_132616/g.383388 Transcript_132616/m.383388 type:complete len:419 (+) Transcript_132616:94-1350(+)